MNFCSYGGLSSSPSTDWRAKYIEADNMLSEARNELDDFVHSSKELEEELLRELDRTERTQKELQDKVSRVETDRDEWKVRCYCPAAVALKGPRGLPAPSEQVHFITNKSQYNRELVAQRTRYPPAGTSEVEGPIP